MSGQELKRLFQLEVAPKTEKDVQELMSLKYHPRGKIPTISKNSPNKIVWRYWNLVPPWYKGDPYRMKFSTFNARAEEVDRKPSYRHAWREKQRCLIPASWFYEFETVDVEGQKKPVKKPYRVQVKHVEVFAMAGLYEVWRDAEGQEFLSATMLTCAAVEPLRTIHERQPVILDETQWEAWLDVNTAETEITAMLGARDDLEMWEIDGRFNRLSGEALSEGRY